jgi:hypothetical protein
MNPVASPCCTVYIRRALSFLPGGEMVSQRSLDPSLGVRILPRQRFFKTVWNEDENLRVRNETRD